MRNEIRKNKKETKKIKENKIRKGGWGKQYQCVAIWQNRCCASEDFSRRQRLRLQAATQATQWRVRSDTCGIATSPKPALASAPLPHTIHYPDVHRSGSVDHTQREGEARHLMDGKVAANWIVPIRQSFCSFLKLAAIVSTRCCT